MWAGVFFLLLGLMGFCCCGLMGFYCCGLVVFFTAGAGGFLLLWAGGFLLLWAGGCLLLGLVDFYCCGPLGKHYIRRTAKARDLGCLILADLGLRSLALADFIGTAPVSSLHGEGAVR